MASVVGSASIILAAIGIVAVGELIAARQQSRVAETSTAVLHEAVKLQPENMAAAQQSETKKLVPAITTVSPGVGATTGTPAATRATKPATPDAPTTVKPAPEPIVPKKPAPESANKSQPEVGSLPSKALAPAMSTIDAAPATTIIGCLEFNDSRFHLRDTHGDAPRSRNWKSAFLTRRSAAIDLVDASNTLKLSTHVGERVSATGTLVNREMRAQSLQSVAPSCQ